MPTIKASVFTTQTHRGKSAGTATVNGGLICNVTFNNLDDKQREYCRLVAITNFHQLVWMAEYMNSGLSFEQSIVKYLKS